MKIIEKCIDIFKKFEAKKIDLDLGHYHIDIREECRNNIFLMNNCDLGVIYSFDGIYDEMLLEEELQFKANSIFKGIKQSIDSLGSKVVFQVICSQRSVKATSGKDLGDVFRQDEEYINNTYPLVERKYYLTLRYDSGFKQKSSWWKDLFTEESILLGKASSAMAENVTLFDNFLKDIEIQFDQDFQLKRINHKEYIKITQGILNAGKNTELVPSSININEQIIHQEITAESSEIKLKDGTSIRPIVIDKIPEFFGLGMMKSFLQSIPLTNWDFVWIFSHPSTEYDQKYLAKETWFGNKVSKRDDFENLLNFKSNISSTRPYGKQSLRLLVYNANCSDLSKIKSVALDTLGAHALPENQIALHQLMTSLPLNCREEAHNIKCGAKTIRLENALKYIPFYKGSPNLSGERIVIGRNFAPTSFDLFAGYGNKMTTVLGMSRAGKSVLTNQLVLEFRSRYSSGIVRIVDRKTSYQKLCDLDKGRIVYFNEQALVKKPYSPFAIKNWDYDDIENLYLLIATAITEQNQDAVLTSLHRELLYESLKLTYNTHAKNIESSRANGVKINQHPIWEDVLGLMPTACLSLKKSGIEDIEKVRSDISKWTISLLPTGIYGQIFSKLELESEETEEIGILVYDLDGIVDPTLKLLCSMMAFMKISRDLAKKPTSTRKLVIFEELGMLVQGKSSSQKICEEFIQNVVKTCAKLNAQAITLTNNVDDYSKAIAGKTIWENSTQKIFLPLGSMYANAYKAWKNEFSEAHWEVLKSLRKELSLNRSQALIISQNDMKPFEGSIFIPLSPFMDAITTTSGPQMEKYHELVNCGLKPRDAIEELSIKYPYGVGLE